MFGTAFALFSDDGEGETYTCFIYLFMCGGCLVGGKRVNDAKIIETCIADFLLPV